MANSKNNNSEKKNKEKKGKTKAKIKDGYQMLLKMKLSMYRG